MKLKMLYFLIYHATPLSIIEIENVLFFNISCDPFIDYRNKTVFGKLNACTDTFDAFNG